MKGQHLTGFDAMVRFGRARIRLVQGRLPRFMSAGVFVPANSRGIMAAGLASEIRRLAGPDVEHELQAQAPLNVGSVYLTAPGNLVDRGVVQIAHGVIIRTPGDRPALGTSEQVLGEGLQALDDTGIKSIALSSFNRQLDERKAGDNAKNLATGIAAHLRRSPRIIDITLTSIDPDYLRSAVQRLLDLGASWE